MKMNYISDVSRVLRIVRRARAASTDGKEDIIYSI